MSNSSKRAAQSCIRERLEGLGIDQPSGTGDLEVLPAEDEALGLAPGDDVTVAATDPNLRLTLRHGDSTGAGRPPETDVLRFGVGVEHDGRRGPKSPGDDDLPIGGPFQRRLAHRFSWFSGDHGEPSLPSL
jgi:hypothetical protein